MRKYTHSTLGIWYKMRPWVAHYAPALLEFLEPRARVRYQYMYYIRTSNHWELWSWTLLSLLRTLAWLRSSTDHQLNPMEYVPVYSTHAEIKKRERKKHWILLSAWAHIFHSLCSILYIYILYLSHSVFVSFFFCLFHPLPVKSTRLLSLTFTSDESEIWGIFYSLSLVMCPYCTICTSQKLESLLMIFFFFTEDWDYRSRILPDIEYTFIVSKVWCAKANPRLIPSTIHHFVIKFLWMFFFSFFCSHLLCDIYCYSQRSSRKIFSRTLQSSILQ